MRLQESMLFVPITWRANFCARKFISFVAFEHEKIPNDVDASASRARANPAAARVERLVPGRGPKRAAVADERRGEATLHGMGSFGRCHANIVPRARVDGSNCLLPLAHDPAGLVGVDRLEHARGISSWVSQRPPTAPSSTCR